MRNSPFVIAHRGASACFPENTIPAFKAAMDMSADMLEMDVQLSADGVPVVYHGQKLNTHTNGNGLLSDKTFRELTSLDAGAWFEKKFEGVRIPSLEEVLNLTAGKIALNIEIKSEAVFDTVEGGVEEKCLNLIYKHGLQNEVLLSSFDYRAIQHLRSLDDSIPLAILYEKSQSAGKLPHELLKCYNADVFNCSYSQLTKKRLANIKNHDLPVLVYTINTKSKMRRLIKLEVDGIFSNKPALLKKLL